MLIIRPKLVGVDSSVLAEWAKDTFSPDSSARAAAKEAFVPFVKSGWTPIISLHHFEELVCHADDQIVADRIAFIRSFPHIAWVKASADPTLLGSIADLLGVEIETFLDLPEQSAARHQEAVRQGLVNYGSPNQIGNLDVWRDSRVHLQERQVRAREIASLAHGDTEGLVKTIGDLAQMYAMTDPEAEIAFQEETIRRTRDLSDHGDQRIRDPERVAGALVDDAFKIFRSIRDSGDSLLDGLLKEYDVPREDISESMCLGDFFDLVALRKRVRELCESRRLNLDQVWARVRNADIPSQLVQDAVRRAQKAAVKAKGSDLGDSYLAAFAPYLDAVIVDKRTLEYLRQVCARSEEFKDLAGSFARVSTYRELGSVLEDV